MDISKDYMCSDGSDAAIILMLGSGKVSGYYSEHSCLPLRLCFTGLCSGKARRL